MSTPDAGRPPHEETADELELPGDEQPNRTVRIPSGAGYPMRNAFARHCAHRDRVNGWRDALVRG